MDTLLGVSALLLAIAWIFHMALKSAARPPVIAHLGEGDRSPDYLFRPASGEVQFSELWENGSIVVIWLRHYGCVFGQRQLEVLRQLEPDFQKWGVSLAVIGQAHPQITKQLSEEFECWYTLLPDPTRRSFSKFGMGFTRYRDIIRSKEVNQSYRDAKHQGFSAHANRSFMGSSDWLQLGGSAIIDYRARIRFLHRAERIDELAPLDKIFARLRELNEDSKPENVPTA